MRRLAEAQRTYAAVFRVQLLDGQRAAGVETIRGWARMTLAAAWHVRQLLDRPVDIEGMLEVAEQFGFRTWLEYLLSTGGSVTIIEFRRSAAPNGLGAWDAQGTKLTRDGRT